VVTVERYRPEIGGAELVVQRLAEGLGDRGHDVTVMTSGKRGAARVDGVHVERFPLAGNLVQGIRGNAAEPLALIRELDPDVVLNYAAQTWPTDVCASLLDDPDRPAMVLAPCGFSGLGAPGWAGYFETVRGWLPRYDGLIFHSSRYRDWDFAADAGAERRHVIPNGAEPPVAGQRARAGLATDTGLVLTVGSHFRSKGHGDFVAAVRALRRRHPVAGVIVAPPRRGLDAARGCHLYCRLQQALPWSGIGLIDGRRRDDVLDAIASADVLLLPSAVECSPLVILEAMAAGVPWVSYDVGNIRELEGGLVARSLEELVSLSGEVLDGRHPQLGEQGRRAWERDHRWEPICERYEAVLEGALRRRSDERDHSLATRKR
jgi:glycosyltransferase involved in cell wall biosynthesis